MATVPRIGVTRCSITADYEESVRRAGGDPVLLDWNALSLDGALARIDGVLLTGGRDVDPFFYAQPAHQAVQAAEPGRDSFELALASRAIAGDVPLLAICRGMQVLNVAAGGTLIQDIPTQVASAIPHTIATPKDRIAHDVAIVPGTRTRELLGGRDNRGVNSRHHQAVDRVGERFVLSARAPDGVAEAMEHSTARFCVAVQWHPENFCRSGEFLSLFEAFVNACRG